jgi:hypothetical protein
VNEGVAPTHPNRLPTLESVFPPWSGICAKYDAICEKLPDQYSLKREADQKEESIHWEQTAFELLLTLLVNLRIPFNTGAEFVGPTIKTLDGKDKEIDFVISVKNTELYFGVTSFYDSPKDFAKDAATADIPITELTRSNGTISNTAKITSLRSQEIYFNRRLVVRVASEGKHLLPTDYIYIFFPKIAPGFGRGLDAIARDFSFDGHDYTYPVNGITGVIVIGAYLKIESKVQSIEPEIWLVKTKAFSHASETARTLLAQLDGITVDMRPQFQEIRSLLQREGPASQATDETAFWHCPNKV